MSEEVTLGQLIHRLVIWDEEDNLIATQTKENLDLRDAFLEYGIIIPTDVPKPIRDDLHSICIYYKAAQLEQPITLKEARKITKEMITNG